MTARILSIAGILVFFLGVGLAAVMEDGFTRLTKVITLAGVGILLIAGVLAFSEIVRTLRTRQGRFGTNVIFGTLALFGILVIANFLSSRYYERADLTANARFSLAPQSERQVTRTELRRQFQIVRLL